MSPRVMHIIGLLAGIALIGTCFMPWVHYNSINVTFTGFHVTQFAGGIYYGKAGTVITPLTVIILLLMLIPKVWAKRVNLLLAGLLFAYCIRTYIVFTGSLFEGDVDRLPGIYLLLVLSFILLVSAVFPKIEEKLTAKNQD